MSQNDIDKYIDSPLLGRSKLPSESERKVLEEAVNSMPVAVFQALNRKMNAMGLAITILSKDEIQ